MENKGNIQYVDPIVTRVKFERELQEFKQNELEYRKKGIIFFNKTSDFSINLLFAIPELKPSPIAFAVNIDYTNWDVEPPSITFIDPFSGKILQREAIGIKFYQVKDKNSIMVINGQIAELDLLQGGNGISPFFCIPGVREYHKHPAHSGNSWMLYRTREEGKLCVLIDQLYSHSISQIGGYSFNMEVKASANVNGLSIDINKLRT